MPPFSHFHPHVEEHSLNLTRGLARLPDDFTARICEVCLGKGEYEQTYCDGPNGSMRLTGGCDYCDGMGLLVGSKPAPMSVVQQVLNAADQA